MKKNHQSLNGGPTETGLIFARTVYKHGNSKVVCIPDQLSKALGIKVGAKVFIIRRKSDFLVKLISTREQLKLAVS